MSRVEGSSFEGPLAKPQLSSSPAPQLDHFPGSPALQLPSSFPRSSGLVLLVAILAFTACGPAKQGPPPAVPVTAAQAEVRPMPLSLNVVGTVEPIESVSIKAQVGGVIDEVAFKEGDDVKAGQLLFRIDPRPFQAALDAAKAQLAKDKAQAANAEVQAKRYADLVAKEYVTQEQYDATRTEAEMLKSAVLADEAAVEQARLDLSYASITAPIAGRTGSLLVKKGNVVKANDLPLVLINQMRPIRVSFAIPATQLPQVQKYAAADPLQVHVNPSRDGNSERIKGLVSFMDNAVDPSTGTVTLKAEFSNEDGALWPGQFVDTELVLTVEPGALTVPAGAVVTGQDGTFVFVVGEGNKAEKRDVKVNRTVGGEVVVDRGLKAGETVVTDGQLRLVPGTPVEIKPAAADQAEPKSKPAGSPA